MIVSIKIKNCFIYKDEVEFSLKADMRFKKFSQNVVNTENLNILKTAVIFGPNNSGKTNLINCFKALRLIMLNKENRLQKNLFSTDNICSMEVRFVVDNIEYLFSFRYDSQKKEYLYERYYKIEYDDYKNEKICDLLIRDTEKSKYYCKNQELLNALKIASKSNLVIYLFDAEKFDILSSLKNIITTFANKIQIIDMNNIPIDKTLNIMKGNTATKEKITKFIKSADLSLDNMVYLSDDELVIKKIDENGEKAQEDVLNVPSKIIDKLHLASVYNGKYVPSIVFDSTGTKKITAIASYVIEALENGNILLVDELDNSLHFKLTRAIIALFNNELNCKSQLICTVHDVSLLDCKKMFRKEQIWFSYKDSHRPYLYSLSEFKSNKDGVRGDSDSIVEKYKKGLLGALPEPDLFDVLLEVE